MFLMSGVGFKIYFYFSILEIYYIYLFSRVVQRCFIGLRFKNGIFDMGFFFLREINYLVQDCVISIENNGYFFVCCVKRYSIWFIEKS